MPSRSRILIAAIMIFTISASATAFAGFQMRGAQYGGDTGIAGAKKVDEVDKEAITPVISSENAGVKDDDAAAKKDNPKEKNVLKAPEGAVEAKTDDANKATANTDNVSGFGKDLPLNISLQQIVPAKYQVVLDETIDGKTLTTWQGGAAWQDVLDKMLKSHKFSYTLNGTVISIHNDAPKVQNIGRNDKIANDEKQKLPAMAAQEKPTGDLTAVQKAQKDVAEAKGVKSSKKMTAKEKKAAAANAKSEDFKRLYDASNRQARQDMISSTDDAKTPLSILDKNAKEITPLKGPAFEFNPEAKPDTNWRMANARWVGHKDQSLKEILGDWSRREGIELYWAIDYDYKLNRDIALGGEYSNAVAKLLYLFKDTRPQPYGQLHKGTRGPLVLVVNSYDLSH